MAEAHLTPDEEMLDENLLASLVQLDEALRAGRVPTNPDCALTGDACADLSTAAYGLVELEVAFPRSRVGGPERASVAMPRRIGRFEIEGFLGSGGFAIVYKARDHLLDRTVAVKIPRPHALASPDLRKRFVREAQAAGQLDHPHIVPIYEAGEEGELPYIAYAFCEGPTLAAWMKESVGPLPSRQAARLMIQLAEAVQYCHEHGILHRDIKPANVLLFPQSKPADESFPFVLRLSDLGLAKLIATSLEETATEMVMGTPLYMSPEQADGRQGDVGPACDIYSLGAVLYYLLCGRPPFLAAGLLEALAQVTEREPIAPLDLNPAVDPELNTVCLNCLEKSPSRRYSSAQALANDLRRYLAGEPILARPATIADRAWRWCRRKPVQAGLLAGVVCLTLGLLTTLLWHAQSSYVMQQEIIQRNKQLAESLQTAKLHERIAEQSERRVSQMLYAADLQLAVVEITKNDLRDATGLLRRQAERDREFCWYYLHNQVTPSNRLIANVQQKVWCVAYSADGRRFAAGGDRSLVNIFDVNDNYRPIRTLDTGQIEVNCVAFSPDNLTLATTGDDGRAGLWNVESGELLHWLNVIPDGRLYNIIFLNEGSQVVICGQSAELSIWDVATGTRVKTWRTPHERTINALAVSPDGQLLASGGTEGLAAVFRLGVDEPLGVWLGHRGPVSAVQFSMDGKFLITGGRDGYIRHVEISPDQLRQYLRRPDRITEIVVNRNGELACGDSGGVIFLLDPRSPPTFSEPASEWTEQKLWAASDVRIGGLAFTPDGRAIVSGDENGDVRYWSEAELRQSVRLLPGTGSLRSQICVGEDPNILYVASAAGVEVWDVRLNERTATIAPGMDIRACAYVRETESILLGDHRGRIGCVRVDQLSAVEWLELDLFAGLPVACLGSFSQGRSILVQGMSGEFAIVDKEAGRVVAHLSKRATFAASPDERWLALGRLDADDVEILLLDTFQIVAQLPPHRTSVSHLELSRDGSLLLSASNDRTAVLWDTATWQPKHTLLGHSEKLFAAAISPDGKTVATGDQGGIIKLWHTVSGQELFELPPQDGEVTALVFSADGQKLYALVGGETVTIFSAPSPP